MVDSRFKWVIPSCFLFYFFIGVAYSQVTSRMPALKELAHVDEAGLGLALSSLGAGSLLGFATIPFLLKHISSRTMLRSATVANVALLFGIPLVFNLESLCVTFAFLGLAFAYFEVAMNTQIINLELKSGGQYMLRMHAGFNVGALTGSLSGSAFAFYSIGVGSNLLAVGLFFCIPLILGSLFLLEDVTPEGMDKKKGMGKIPLAVIFCGIFALCAYTIEGAVAEWGSLVMIQEKNASESLAALVYGSFSFVTAITRFGADKLRSMIGDFRLILFGALTAFLGMSIVIFTSSPYLTLFAYGLCGVGLAPVVPVILSKVGHRNDIHPAAATTVVSLFGYSGVLVVPPSLGLLANQYGLINAMFLPLGLIFVVVMSSFVIRKMKG